MGEIQFISITPRNEFRSIRELLARATYAILERGAFDASCINDTIMPNVIFPRGALWVHRLKLPKVKRWRQAAAADVVSIEFSFLFAMMLSTARLPVTLM